MNVVAPVLPGETLGDKYRVERILGQGGMGIVVAAKHVELDERVAIKFLLGKPSTSAVDRFLREARAAVKVKGEHVCRVLDFGRLDTGEPYIVMEHLEGTDLARKIEKEGPQPLAAAVGWIIEVCDALGEAHALGIVHRDVKPANVFLAERRDGSASAKVLDFGISKLSSQAPITGTQTPMGSPSYMSPEQMVSAHDVDARTDIWSLGVTLYELLAGKPPFAADSMVQLSVVVREKEPAPLEGIPDDLSRVIERCLAKDPRDRYDTVAALVADLAPFAPEGTRGLVLRHARRDSNAEHAAALAATAPEPTGPTTARPHETFAPLQSTLSEGKPNGEPRRRRWPVVVVGAAALAASAAGAAVLSRSPAAAIPPLASEAAASLQNDASTDTLAVASVASSVPTVAKTDAPLATAKSPPAPSQTSKPNVRSAAAIASGSPAIESSATAASASVAAPPPPPAKPDARKRRELDREDP
jgi:serine/threonine protein kinase